MRKVSEDAEAAIVAEYRSNVPVQQIMDSHGIAEGALYRTLRRAGIEPGRPFNGRRPKEWTPEDLDRLRALRDSGATVAAICKVFRAGHERVNRALEQLDLDNGSS
jgi:hypothetical protein